MCLSTAPSAFEWNRESHLNAARAPEAAIRSTVESIGYMKLLRVYPVEEAGFASLDWTEAGMEAWRDLSRIAVE